MLAELLAALSLPTDLGMGQPMDHVLRQTLIARERRAGGDNDVLVSATTATPTQSRTSFSASLGAIKDARKIGKSLFPVHRKATISSSAASKV